MNHLTNKAQKYQPSGHAVYTQWGWEPVEDDRLNDNQQAPMLAGWFILLMVVSIVIIGGLGIAWMIR